MDDTSESFENAAPVSPSGIAERAQRQFQPVSAPAAVGRVLPHSLEAEEYLLSCCLIDGKDVVSRCVAAQIRPGSFYDPKHGIVYERLLDLYNRQEPIDISVVAEELKTARQLDQIGGYAFLTQVSSRIPTTAQASYFVEKVRELAVRREMILSDRANTEDCHDLTLSFDDLVASRTRRMQSATMQTRSVERSFTIWKPSQFIAYTAPADAIILGESIVERGKWTSFVGIGGLGKTRLALYLAVCQILGRDWCGLKVHGKPLRWLILSTENGLRRWKTDLGAMLTALNEEQRAAIEAHLSIMALTDDEDGDLNAGSDESMDRLRVTFRQQKPDAIVFDPFADMIDGDENKTEDVVGTLRRLRQIVRKESPAAAVLLVHHARTGAGNVAQAGDNFSAGNFGRGAKALYSAVRAEIQLAPGDRDDSNMIVLACGKNSDGPKFAARGIVFSADDCSYSVDPSFDLDTWRDDVSGKRTGKSCSIADAVEAVRELAPGAGTEAKTSDIVDAMKSSTAAEVRTCKTRLADALKSGYLRRGSRTGFYRLGSKPLPRQA